MVITMNNFLNSRSDLIIEKNNFKISTNNQVEIIENKNNNFIYKTIFFDNLFNNFEIKKTLKNQIIYFIKKMGISKDKHFFIVGLGNENHTADSIGPKVIKYINVNSHFEDMGIHINNAKISALEPGVLGQTGINTKRIIESVVEEIKPNIVILIDSYVSKNIDYLNHTIQITNEGIIPGSGLKSINSEISYKTLKIPVLVIGVTTAIEIKNNHISYILSSKDIDDYVSQISKIIGETINDTLYHL